MTRRGAPIASLPSVLAGAVLLAACAAPPTGFLLAALPMKIEGGTGAPVRIVALVPR